MYSLRLTCQAEDVDFLSADLWACGTAGIRELDSENGSVTLIAGFETNVCRATLLSQFARFQPQWSEESSIDWVKQTQDAWPARLIGERFFLAPHWNQEPTPAGRFRLIHNPGLACGTGEHACTRLALRALERCVAPGDRVADIGTGSGILSIAALQLGAAFAVGVDRDEAALPAARENFEWNHLQPQIAGGSADCIVNAFADVTVANISGTVLLSIFDDLLRITRSGGRVILTGFPESEAEVFVRGL